MVSDWDFPVLEGSRRSCAIFHNYYENWCWSKESFIKQCHCCGNIWISTSYKVNCPFCFSNNFHIIPFRNHVNFSIEWLESHGFPYIRSLITDD